MNRELVLTDCSKEQIFLVKQACLRLVKAFISTKKAQHVKKLEVWARTICLKAMRDTLPEYPSYPLPHLPRKSRKVPTN